ncbi:MAG: discoidin domain-containing protein, partial [bacterium]
RDQAINTGSFTAYFDNLTSWLDQKVPADRGLITKKKLLALLNDPAFSAALAERHFMAKIWGPKKGMGNLDSFAKADPLNKEFLRWVMSNGRLMDDVLLTRTPSTMFARKDDSHDLNAAILEDWKKIYYSDPASRQGLYLRLAVACVLRPPGTGNPGAGAAKVQCSVFDRYMYFRKVHANKELMPSFDTLTTWELTQVVSSGASNDDLTWGRDALNTWNPSFRNNEGVVAMTSQVWYRGANGVPYHDMSLVMGAGGKCGPRSSFGVFINQAFGIPSLGVAQPAHAAVCWRDRNGNWQIGYGRSWNASKVADRFNMSGSEFLEMVKERKTAKFGQIEHLRWIASLIESPTSPYLIPASQQYAKARATAVMSLWQTLPKAYGKVEGVPFARTPDKSSALTSFAAPQNNGDYYYARVRGFVHPPASGNYVFGITSDDDSDLFLSTDEDPDNIVFISHVSGSSDPKDFSRKSQPVRLEGGKKYFIEAVHRELDGGDHLSVAWTGPGAIEGVIPGANLSPYPAGAKGTITREVWFDKAATNVQPVTVKSELKPEAPITVATGVIHVEAENSFTRGNVEVMDCYTGGKQVYFPAMTAHAWCGYNISVPKTGTYQFTARVAAVNWGQFLYVRSFGAMYPVKEAKASNVYRGDIKNLGPQLAIDHDLSTRWAMDFGKERGWIELDLGQPREISKIIIDERALNYIKKHTVEYKVNDEWKMLLQGTYVKDYVKSFSPVTAQYVRFSSFDTDAPTGGPTIRDFSVGKVLDGNGFIEIPWSPGTLDAAKLQNKDAKGGLSGRWQTTKPLDMYLVKGEQKIWVCTQTLEAQRSVALRWFELKPTGE